MASALKNIALGGKFSHISKTLGLAFYLLLVTYSQTLSAQNKDSVPDPSVKIIARAQDNKILLRWATDNALAWQRGNQYGYTLERFTVYRDSKRLANPERKLLSDTPTKPAPVEQWEALATTDNNAAIMAQAIYGEDFQVGAEEGVLMRIVNQSEMLQQRYSFALLSADMNFEAAKLAGLGFEDTDIKSNESYLYRIVSEIPQETTVVTEGTVLIDASDNDELPAPIDLVGVFEDKSVMLTWEYEMFKTIYTSYQVERSEDGISYQALGDLPVVNLNNSEDNPAKRMYYMDTIPQNNKTYHYRVLGISPFGEKGKVSESISGMGIIALTHNPFITEYDLLGETAAKITWEFPVEAENEVSEFQLRAAPKDQGPYETVREDISVKQRTIEVDGLSGTNYLKVIAVGKDSTEKESFSALVQLVDSVPPARPINLVGVVDSTGVVKINWDANTESDLMGYRVFRGNLEQEEYAQLTRDPIPGTVFQDTVQIKSLNDKVYYSVVAVDKRYNMSEYSEALTLKKPDVIPPSAPVFDDFKVTEKGVSLSFIPSSSTDVEKHQLYRKAISGPEEDRARNQADGWELIWESKDSISEFLDDTVDSATKYSYSIQAMDDSGLISDSSPNITIETASNMEEKMVKGLNYEVNREQNKIRLYWRKLPADVSEIIIYKSKIDGRPALWKQLPANLNQIVDQNLSPSNIYRYQIRPVLFDGRYGPLETVEVNY